MNNVNKLKPKKNLAGMHAHMQVCACTTDVHVCRCVYVQNISMYGNAVYKNLIRFYKIHHKSISLYDSW